MEIHENKQNYTELMRHYNESQNSMFLAKEYENRMKLMEEELHKLNSYLMNSQKEKEDLIIKCEKFQINESKINDFSRQNDRLRELLDNKLQELEEVKEKCIRYDHDYSRYEVKIKDLLMELDNVKKRSEFLEKEIGELLIYSFN